MRIDVFEVEDWERSCFTELGDGHEVNFFSEALDEDNAADHAGAQVVSTFIYSRLGREVLGKLESVGLIATRSTGFDHIDIDYCKEREILVANVPAYGDNTVAEHVFGLLLTVSKNLYEAIDRTRKGDFSQRGLQGFDLEGKTLGVVGAGAIGRHVIEIAGGFGMKALAFDVNPEAKLAKKLGFEYVDMDRLLAESDVITLHVPYNSKTHHLINQAAFDKMKQGAVLINTARGPLVDHQALLGALSTGRVKAAGLDVLPDEPVIREEAELLRTVFNRKHNLENLLADHILLRLRNVVITPHSAFNTREAVGRILAATADNIKSYLENSPRNIVAQTG